MWVDELRRPRPFQRHRRDHRGLYKGKTGDTPKGDGRVGVLRSDESDTEQRHRWGRDREDSGMTEVKYLGLGLEIRDKSGSVVTFVSQTSVSRVCGAPRLP